MCVDDLDGLYSSKCNCLANIVMDLKVLGVAGELMEYNYIFVEEKR